jgi:deazaflavin-dependent oxidoreductase (nitroreductase family)
MTPEFDGGMQLPQWLARFNRHVTNPVQRLWAGWLPGFGILDHVGRKSGKTYRTPLNVFPTDDGVAILLSYGPDRDWLKNITAAGHARIKRMGKTIDVADPRIVSKAEAAAHVTGPSRAIFPRVPFDSAVLLTRR